MNRPHSTQRGVTPFFLLIIIALLSVAAVGVSKYFAPATQMLRPNPLANAVRGYIAMSVARSRTPTSDVFRPVAARSDTALAVSVPPRVDNTKDIYLPGVMVFLDDPQTQRRSEEVRTDLSGRFTLYAPEAGRYRICWKSDVYDNGCTDVFVSAGFSPQFLSTVHITTPPRKDFVAVTGHVTTKDGTLPRTFDPLLNINAFATVSVADQNANPIGTVYVNNFGDYLLPYVPVRQSVNLTAKIEEGKFTQEIRPEAQMERAALHHVDLKIQNSRPFIEPLIANGPNNARVQNAAPGSEVSIVARARDDDGDAVNFSWFVDPTAGQLLQTSGASVSWKLPMAPGIYTITAVASDKKGGYDKAVLSVPVGAKGIPFDGIVVEQNGTPVDQADVEIVGNLPVKTGPNGHFSLNVSEANHYICNVRKPGYALNSQLYDHALTGGRWILRRAQEVTIDPTRDQVINNDGRTQADCPGPNSGQAGLGLGGDLLKDPQRQDGGGHVIDSPLTACRECGPDGKETDLFVSKRDLSRSIMPRDLKLPRCGPGVRIAIPANSILDPNGILAKALITANVATVDLLSPQQMPGDDSVSPIAGGNSALKSFGAGSLDLPPGFTLRPGASATVTIPVDRARLLKGTLPPTVPLLTYNEQLGLWKEEGVLTLDTLNGVKVYKGSVTHFSEFNADTLFSDNACVRVFSPGIMGNYELELMTPYPDGSPHYKNLLIENSVQHEHVIYNITPNVDITLAPMTLGPNRQMLGFYIVNSGPALNFGTPGVGNAPPGPHYSICQNFVVLKAGNAPDSPFGGEFLHGLGFLNAVNLGVDDLTPAGSGGTALQIAITDATRAYYDRVDPGAGTLDTLVKFKAKYGLNPDPNTPNTAAGELVATYANSGDLGFGRDMHCINSAGDIGCYVTNYGVGYSNADPDGGAGGTPDLNDAEAAASVTDASGVSRVGFSGSSVGATVAMEYAQINGTGPRVVKFYVYKNNVRSVSANLDGRGERPVPQLCMVCHGGLIPNQVSGLPIFGTPADVDFHSRFLPFDDRLFTFPVARPRAVQNAAIKSLNKTMVDLVPSGADPNNDPVRQVVKTLYDDGTLGGSAGQIFDSPVTAWKPSQPAPNNFPNQTNFYNKVVANGCRTCHIAQVFPQLNFNTSDSFVNLGVGSGNKLMLGTAELRACGDYVMPHALRTHDIFWNNFPELPAISPTIAAIAMPSEFNSFGNGIGGATWTTNLCTTFIPNLEASPSNFYEHTIQAIWNAKCINCHVGAGAPFGLALTQGVSHSLLLAGRVVPGDDNPATPGNKVLRRITSTGGDRMPQGCVVPPATPGPGQVSCLPQADIDKIKAWVRYGAR